MAALLKEITARQGATQVVAYQTESLNPEPGKNQLYELLTDGKRNGIVVAASKSEALSFAVRGATRRSRSDDPTSTGFRTFDVRLML